MNNVELIQQIIKAMEPSDMSDGECMDEVIDLIRKAGWDIPWLDDEDDAAPGDSQNNVGANQEQVIRTSTIKITTNERGVLCLIGFIHHWK